MALYLSIFTLSLFRSCFCFRFCIAFSFNRELRLSVFFWWINQGFWWLFCWYRQFSFWFWCLFYFCCFSRSFYTVWAFSKISLDWCWFFRRGRNLIESMKSSTKLLVRWKKIINIFYVKEKSFSSFDRNSWSTEKISGVFSKKISILVFLEVENLCTVQWQFYRIFSII